MEIRSYKLYDFMEYFCLTWIKECQPPKNKEIHVSGESVMYYFNSATQDLSSTSSALSHCSASLISNSDLDFWTSTNYFNSPSIFIPFSTGRSLVLAWAQSDISQTLYWEYPLFIYLFSSCKKTLSLRLFISIIKLDTEDPSILII